MSKLRIALVAALLVALLSPFAVLAAGTFYCNTGITSGGNGTYASPWACNTPDQLHYVIYDLVCARYGGGVLYAIRPGGYTYYNIAYTSQNGQWVCNITYQADYPGYPPNTGVDLPAPLIAALAGAAALVLVVAGLLLRRKTA
jgi:hypothetical protein